MGTNRHRAPRPRRNDPQVAKRKSGGTMMSRVSSSCCSRRGSRSHKTDRFRKPLFDGRRHRPGPRDRGTGRATSSRGWPVRPAERRDRRRINCRRRFNRRCRAELCAAVHFTTTLPPMVAAGACTAIRHLKAWNEEERSTSTSPPSPSTGSPWRACRPSTTRRTSSRS
jgi:hypothetical protein